MKDNILCSCMARHVSAKNISSYFHMRRFSQPVTPSTSTSLLEIIRPAYGTSIVMLVDKVTLRSLTHMCTQTEIAEHGVVSVVLIDTVESLSGAAGNPCIAYICPSNESLSTVHKIVRLSQERKLFKEFHLVFTGLVPENTVSDLATSDSSKFIQTIRVVFGAHSMLGARFALLPQEAENPYSEASILRQSDNLLNFLLSMGVEPFTVRYLSVSSAAASLAGHLHKHITLRKNLFRYNAKGLINYETKSVKRDGSIVGSKARFPPRTKPLEIIILDRRADLQSVIKQNWALLPLLSDFELLNSETLEFCDETNTKHQFSKTSSVLFDQTYAADFFVLTMSIIPELRKYSQELSLSQGEKNAIIGICSAASTLSEYIGKINHTRISQIENSMHNDNSSEAITLLEKFFVSQGTQKGKTKQDILLHIMESDTSTAKKLLFLEIVVSLFFSLVVLITLQYNVFSIQSVLKKLQAIATKFFHAAEQANIELAQQMGAHSEKLSQHIKRLTNATSVYLTNYGRQLANAFYYQWDNVETSAKTAITNRVVSATSPGQGTSLDGNMELTAYLNGHNASLQQTDPTILSQIGANYSYKPRVLSVAEAAICNLLLESDFPITSATDRSQMADVLRDSEEHQVLIYVLGGVSQSEHAALETYDYYGQFNQAARSPGLFKRRQQEVTGAVMCGLYNKLVTLASDRIVSRLSLVRDLVEDITSGQGVFLKA